MYFNSFIRNRKITIDGAMSTALENLGYNTQSDLWTAGADLIMTDIYQANTQAFKNAWLL